MQYMNYLRIKAGGGILWLAVFPTCCQDGQATDKARDLYESGET